MLWLHVRSAVTIFGKLLSVAFNESLPAAIPSRAIPISALPPTDARTVVEREMKDIAAMLKPGLRQGEDAKARIRPLLALDGAVTGREEAPTEVELERVPARLSRADSASTAVKPLLSPTLLTGTRCAFTPWNQPDSHVSTVPIQPGQPKVKTWTTRP